MSFNGSGTYTPPASVFPIVNGTLGDATQVDAIISDISTALSQCVTKDGQQTVVTNIPMNGFRFTGVGAGQSRTDTATLANVQDGTGVYVGTVTQTGNAITLTPSPAIAAYAVGQRFSFVVPSANTGAVTVAISGLAAKAINLTSAVGLASGDLQAGTLTEITYDGTQFLLTGRGSAPTLTNPTITGTVSGNPTITAPIIASPSITSPTITGFGAGALVLLDIKFASGDAQIDLTSGISSTYDEYRVVIVNYVPTTTATDLHLLVSQDGGSTFKSGGTDYRWTLFGNNDGGTVNAAASASDSKIALSSGGPFQAVANLASQLTISFYAPAGTTIYKYFMFDTIGTSPTFNISRVSGSGLFRLNTSAINGLRFVPSSGTITSGSFYLYGVRKA